MVALVPVPEEVVLRWEADGEFRGRVVADVVRDYGQRVEHLALVRLVEETEDVSTLDDPDGDASLAFCVEVIHEGRAEDWLAALEVNPLPTIGLELPEEVARMADSDPVFRRRCANAAAFLARPVELGSA